MPNVWGIKYGIDPNDPFDAARDKDSNGEDTSRVLSWDYPHRFDRYLGNTEYQALTDGLLLLLCMVGLIGDASIGGVVDSDAVYRTSADIEAYIQSLTPAL